MRYLPAALTLAILTSGTSLSVRAGDDEKNASPLAAIYQCAAIDDEAKRLTCYDDAVGRLKQAESAGEIVAAKSKDLRSIRKEAFGFNLPSLPKLHLPFIKKRKDGEVREDENLKDGEILKQRDDGEILSVAYAVDHITVKRSGAHWFYLTNGQVWVQTDRNRLSYPKRDKNLKVQIRKAAMGSYFLRINGKGRAIRVRRD
jgi:hypothetical protein